MLPPQLPNPAPLSIALATRANPTPTPTPTAVSCSWGSASSSRRRRRPKRKPIAFPPPPLRRLVSSSVRILLPRPRPLGGGWLGRRGRRKAPGEEVAALVLALAFGDRLAILADSWRASGLGQVLGAWAAVLGRGRRRRRNGLRRLAAFFLGIAFCALVSHFRGAAFLEGIGRTGGGRRLLRILLH